MNAISLSGYWAVSLSSVAWGPIIGGMPHEFFMWGSVSQVNVPVVESPRTETLILRPATHPDPSRRWVGDGRGQRVKAPTTLRFTLLVDGLGEESGVPAHPTSDGENVDIRISGNRNCVFMAKIE